MPLTNSLYVRGELTNTETVLVDVGTGFLVEKVGQVSTLTMAMCVLTRTQKLKSAATFYENKIKELTNSLKELEAIVQQKQMNVRTIEEGAESCHQSLLFILYVLTQNYSVTTQNDDTAIKSASILKSRQTKQNLITLCCTRILCHLRDELSHGGLHSKNTPQ